jgi:hypothetical protein
VTESKLEQVLRFQITALGLPEPEYEFVFLPGRKFRFDLAWIKERLAVECNGATWVKGGHSSGYGLRRDYEKMNLAQVNGWIVLQFDSGAIYDGSAINLIQKTLEGRESK